MIESQIDHMNIRTAAIEEVEEATNRVRVAKKQLSDEESSLQKVVRRMSKASFYCGGKPSERAEQQMALADLDWVVGEARKELGMDQPAADSVPRTICTPVHTFTADPRTITVPWLGSAEHLREVALLRDMDAIKRELLSTMASVVA